MELLIEVSNKDNLFLDKVDGIILPLDKYSVESTCYFSMEEISKIVSINKNKTFIKINKNLMNEDIEEVSSILIELDKMGVDGVLFYDLAILELKKELNLGIDLVWNQTHMVNNYKTCNYYYSKGCKYALLGKEITLEEICEIIKKSDISCMVEVISKPSVAFSKRHLITNYYCDLKKEPKDELLVTEKVTDTNYKLIEDSNGTTFFLDIVTNGTGIIKDLFMNNCPFIIIKEYGIEDCFEELVDDTMNYIKGNCSDDMYIEKYKKLGDSTNFFFRKTIYRVKK